MRPLFSFATLLLLLPGLLSPGALSAQAPPAQSPALSTDEGPHVLWEGREARILRVRQGRMEESRRKGPFQLPLPGVCAEPLNLLPTPPTAPPEALEKASRIAAISDVHGRFDRLKALLKAQGLIGPNLGWRYGKGVLLVLGDVLDRGPEVTECLWFLKGLEAQARRAGGRVIPLLGNHEAMVMKGDWRYVHPRYRQLPPDFPDPSQQLGPTTELGRWVRTWPLMVKVGPFLFTHGGLSGSLLEEGLDLTLVNELGRHHLLDGKTTRQTELLFGSRGPLWYRGLIPGATPFSVSQEQLESLLKPFKAETLVVGHTSQPGVTVFHGGRLHAIDAGIHEGREGELWIWERGRAWRGRADGSREPLSEASR